ncbi:unannotated protein [freshwater metagenome]|uniref:Unannotated protein n=1 Tax=freshwater metagenome TaxID=449393 RepID=A0A6J6NR73_9ZZZZ
MGRRGSGLVGALMLALGLTWVPAPAGAADDQSRAEAPATSTYELEVVSHNIAGAMLFHGDGAAVDRVVLQVQKSNPDVVALQEVCATQASALRSRLRGWRVVFTPMTKNHPGCPSLFGGPGQLGEVLASRWPMRDITVTQLGDTYHHISDKTNHITCADIVVKGFASDALRACSTHLRSERGNSRIRTEQTAVIQELFRQRISDGAQAVVVAGDFNAGAARREMDNLYELDRRGELSGLGQFVEGDQSDTRFFGNALDEDGRPVACSATWCRSGEFTHASKADLTSFQHKLDYIFYSDNAADASDVRASCAASTSDHCIYRSAAIVTMRTATGGGGLLGGIIPGLPL